MNGNKVEVLIVEDNPGDAYMIEEMLQDLKLNLNITLAKDGLEAVCILMSKRNGVPDMIILDLNLPKVHGYDVLKLMKADDKLKAIPVVVMTGSLRKEDEERSRDLGAADYCIKPSRAEDMERTTMCLKGHLEPLARGKGKSSGSVSSAHGYLGVLPPDGGNQRIPPPHSDRLIMDVLNTEPWNLWR